MKKEFIEQAELFLKKLKRAKTTYDCLIDCYVSLIENNHTIEDLDSEITGFEKEFKEVLADAYLKLGSTAIVFKDKAFDGIKEFMQSIQTTFGTKDIDISFEMLKTLDFNNEEKANLIKVMNEINELIAFIKDEQTSSNIQKTTIHLSKMSGKSMLLLKSVFYNSEHGWILDLDNNVNCLKVDKLSDVISSTDITKLENSLSNLQTDIDNVKKSVKISDKIKKAIEEVEYVVVITSNLGSTICSAVIPEDELTFGISNFDYELSDDFLEKHPETFGTFRLNKEEHSLFWNDHDVFQEIYLENFNKVGEIPKDIIVNPLVNKVTIFKK